MNLAYIAITALFSIFWLGPNAHAPAVPREEADFLNAAYSRLAVVFAEQKQADTVALKELRKAEEWAQHRLVDASSARRAAAEDLASQRPVYGQTATESSSGRKAAEARLDKAESKEAEARSALLSRNNALENAEARARESEQRRRQEQLELSQLRKEFGLNPTLEMAEKVEERFARVAAEYGVYCDVTWKTSPKPKAVIVYQTKRNRERGGKEIVSLRDITETKEPVLMGYYYVWATRDGRATSDRNRLVSITQKNVSVTIVEDR